MIALDALASSRMANGFGAAGSFKIQVGKAGCTFPVKRLEKLLVLSGGWTDCSRVQSLE
jgi:hypothetical protein